MDEKRLNPDLRMILEYFRKGDAIRPGPWLPPDRARFYQLRALVQAGFLRVSDAPNADCYELT